MFTIYLLILGVCHIAPQEVPFIPVFSPYIDPRISGFPIPIYYDSIINYRLTLESEFRVYTYKFVNSIKKVGNILISGLPTNENIRKKVQDSENKNMMAIFGKVWVPIFLMFSENDDEQIRSSEILKRGERAFFCQNAIPLGL